MTIEQPSEIPAAAAPPQPKNAASMREAAAQLRGMSKRFGDSLDTYFARKRADKEHEYALEERQRPLI